MPDYTIRDPESGRTLTVRGDSPPTEDELAELFAHAGSAGSAGQPAPPSQTGPPTPQAQAGSPAGGLMDSAIETVKDVGIGAMKGVGNTVFGLGKAVRDYTPVGRISDAILPGAFDQRPPEITPTNTAQKVGFTGEQVGEFFLPVGAVGTVGKVAEVAKAGGLTIAQGGTPAEAGVSAGITALPWGAVAGKVGDALGRSAEKNVVQALGATKEWAKSDAAKLAPQILEKGVGGSRSAMLQQAKATAKEVGEKLGKVYEDAAATGATVDGQVIRGNIQLAADKLKIRTPAGTMVPIEGTEGVVAKMGKMDEFLDKMGPDIPIDKAAAIKRTWDHIVSKAGLYGPKAAATATDNANAWAAREGAGAFRDILNQNPTIEALNKEYSFWKGLTNVLKATDLRTQAQGKGLTSVITTTAGGAAGFASGDSMPDRFQRALEGAALGKAITMLQSPTMKTRVTAPLKMALSKALASGNAAAVEMTAGRIAASAPARMGADEVTLSMSGSISQ